MGLCYSIFTLMCSVLEIVVCPFGHCVVCPSFIYGFWLPLWYLLAIVLYVLLLYTASDYPFGIFWPLCCLSFFYIRLLITPLVSSNFSYTHQLGETSMLLLTGSEDNSCFCWPEDWTVARSRSSQRVKQNSCCSRNQSITDLLYLIIFNAFYFNFFSCF